MVKDEWDQGEIWKQIENFKLDLESAEGSLQRIDGIMIRCELEHAWLRLEWNYLRDLGNIKKMLPVATRWKSTQNFNYES